MSISQLRKSRVESPPIVSQSRRPQRRPVGAALLHRHPVRENATELPRRRFLHLAASAGTLPTVPQNARAQSYPSRPITMIVSLAAGSLTDVVGRVIAERMRGPLRQPVIIENVTGANGTIGTGRAARARSDGYTIDFGFIGPHVLNGALYSLPYDVLNDFAPICPVVEAPLVLYASKAMPANDLGGLISWLNANPNRASLGISAPGPHVVAALFQKESQTHFTLAPYRNDSVQDLITGQIDLWIGSVVQLPLARAGNIKTLAVTSDRRSGLAPDIPTFGELGMPTISYEGWGGLFAPKGTPKDIVAKLKWGGGAGTCRSCGAISAH
jgi:tripartite-type tricarboxylate transporter receptor subunit TctC